MKIRYRTRDYFNLTSNTTFGISLHRWLQLLARNSFAVDIRFLPKAIFTTLTAIVNIPFQLYEYFCFYKKVKSAEVKQPVFILGHQRSGTTYLQNVLSRDPQFAYCSTYEALTPYVFLTGGKLIRKIFELSMPATRPQDNVKAGADMPIEEEFALGSMSANSFAHGYYFPNHIQKIFEESVVFSREREKNLPHWKKQFDYFLKKLSFKYGGRRLLLKSPSNTGRMKEILELYPDAKFIHIIRDPYAVYQSNLSLYEKVLPLLGFQKAKEDEIEAFVMTSYEQMHRKFLADKRTLKKGQLFEMGYEDFILDPVTQLKMAYFQLGLEGFEQAEPFFREEIRSVSDYKRNSYSGIGEQKRKEINERWGFMFIEYGYARHGE